MIGRLRVKGLSIAARLVKDSSAICSQVAGLPSQRLFVAIPVLAIVIIGVLLYANYAYSQNTTLSFRTFLLIDVQQKGLSGSVRIYPNGSIGLPGGIMNTTRYLSDGLSGRYPLYTLDKTGVIYVQSTVARAYTLGDFFQVWGEPLGTNDTLNLRYYNGSDTCGTSACSPYYWTMCIHDPLSRTDVPNADWGAHVLQDQEIIRLSYSQIGCA